jgi:hypothetical protein
MAIIDVRAAWLAPNMSVYQMPVILNPSSPFSFYPFMKLSPSRINATTCRYGARFTVYKVEIKE